ncbi:hypothetical protein BKA70DRAFT_1215052 [Coprinopsis sp. MPI-PUGE-AT-0042]|nr:hypothetical protein BKA70DRAFT_1215052 [Coprinopsis sp. MPI-PUGE-AT-0042]
MHTVNRNTTTLNVPLVTPSRRALVTQILHLFSASDNDMHSSSALPHTNYTPQNLKGSSACCADCPSHDLGLATHRVVFDEDVMRHNDLVVDEACLAGGGLYRGGLRGCLRGLDQPRRRNGIRTPFWSTSNQEAKGESNVVQVIRQMREKRREILHTATPPEPSQIPRACVGLQSVRPRIISTTQKQLPAHRQTLEGGSREVNLRCGGSVEEAVDRSEAQEEETSYLGMGDSGSK